MWSRHIRYKQIPHNIVFINNCHWLFSWLLLLKRIWIVSMTETGLLFGAFSSREPPKKNIFLPQISIQTKCPEESHEFCSSITSHFSGCKSNRKMSGLPISLQNCLDGKVQHVNFLNAIRKIMLKTSVKVITIALRFLFHFGRLLPSRQILFLPCLSIFVFALFSAHFANLIDFYVRNESIIPPSVWTAYSNFQPTNNYA